MQAQAPMEAQVAQHVLQATMLHGVLLTATCALKIVEVASTYQKDAALDMMQNVLRAHLVHLKNTGQVDVMVSVRGAVQTVL